MSRKLKGLARFKLIGSSPINGSLRPDKLLQDALAVVRALPDDALIDYSELALRLGHSVAYTRRLREFPETMKYQAKVSSGDTRKVYWGNEKTIKAFKEALEDEKRQSSR